MDSWEALKRCIGPHTEKFAKRLRLSPGYLYKMQRAHGDWNETGEPNPLDKVEEYIDYSLSLGQSVEDAHAPIRYLEERFGRIGFVLPDTADLRIEELTDSLLHSIKEFGEFCREVSHSLIDKTLTEREHACIEREGWEAIRAIALYMKKAKEAVE